MHINEYWRTFGRRRGTYDVARSAVVGLDSLRLIAALSVMMFHLTDQISIGGHSAYVVSHGVAAYPELSTWTRYGWISVPAFFVISGFVISLSASAATPSAFLSGRILRLGPAVWLCAPLSALCSWLAGEGHALKILGRLFNSMTFFPFGTQIDGSYWTLSIEIAFYISIFILLRFDRYSWFLRYIYLLAAISSLYNIALYLGFSSVKLPGRYENLLLIRYGCQFALGAIASQIYRTGVRPRLLMFLLIAVAGCYAQIMPPLAETSDWWPPLIWSAFLAAFFVLMLANGILLAICSPRAMKISREVGKATYPLYLIHQTVGAYLIYVFVTIDMNRYGALALAVTAIFAITACICLIEPALRKAVRPKIVQLCDRLAPHDALQLRAVDRHAVYEFEPDSLRRHAVE